LWDPREGDLSQHVMFMSKLHSLVEIKKKKENKRRSNT